MKRTDGAGPVFARSEIDIDASARQVWAVLAQIEAWPSWNPGVRFAELFDELEVGTAFQWAEGQSTNSCVLTTVDAPRVLVWRGQSMGIGHKRSWRLENRPGGSRVRVEQSMKGMIARIASGRLQQGLQRELDTWVHLLKVEVEARFDEEDEPVNDDQDAGRSGRPASQAGDAS